MYGPGSKDTRVLVPVSPLPTPVKTSYLLLDSDKIKLEIPVYAFKTLLQQFNKSNFMSVESN